MLAQTATPKPKAKAKAAATVTASDVEELKNALAAQQRQIQELKQELSQSNQNWQQAQQQLQQAQAAATDAQAKAQQAAAQAGQQQQAVTDLGTQVSDLKQNATNAALSLQETQKNINAALESPSAIHYKGITITPGGFLAAETVWRSHATGSDINTPFNSIPFAGASQSNLSEFFASGRQSRLSMLAEGKLSSAKLTGYVESDFLSAGLTSNNNQSNSYTLRVRQAWGQAALNSGWSFTGGQMWSLVTETKKGVDNRSEALPMTIDPQYTVGFSWARQEGFRVAKNLGSKAWFAASVENAQATLGGHGASNNFLIGQQGTGGGLYNATANYSYNRTPDFILKTAFEPGWGHYEVFGIISDFRDRVFPCATTSKTGTCGGTKGPSAVGAFNDSGWAGGFGANARGTVAKHFDIGLHFLGGNGVGRYGTATLPDVIARPDGVLKALREIQGLGTIEWHSKRLDVYGNAGVEYAGREWYQNGSTIVGYGAPGFGTSGCGTETPPAGTSTTVATPPSTTGGPTGTTTVPVPGSAGTPLSGGFNPGGLSKCTGDTRAIIEGTLGFWYRIYVGPKGRLQFGPQYSYVVRNTWGGGGYDPTANENMFFTSFRYYLP
jgi:hypothetical protein